MAFSVEPNKDTFIVKLQNLEAAFEPDSRYLVYENLRVIQRGRFWWVLSLLRPFYAIFGRDPYSHVRIERVVNQIFKYVEANQSFLQEDSSLVDRIQTQILEKIETKTRKDFSVHKTAIGALGIKPQPANPETRIPQELAISSNPCIWPTDRDLVWKGIPLPTDPAARAIFIEILERQLEQALRTLANAYKLNKKGFGFHWSFSKESGIRRFSIQIKANESLVHRTEMTLPLSILIRTEQTNNINAFWVHTKNVIAHGGERKVKRTFDLLTGKWFARKRVVKDSSEYKILDHFKDHPNRGIAEVACLFEKASKKARLPIKTMVLQPLYNGTIGDFLGSYLLTSWTTRLGLIIDVTHGLNALHNLSTTITSPGDLPELTLKMFHKDLKPANILVRIEGERVTAAITDFGMTGYLTTGGSLGYKAPEESRLEQRKGLTDDMVTNHNTLYGQAMDVWALGLLFIDLTVKNPQIFLSHQNRVVLTQLPCIHKCIFKAQKTRTFEIQPSLDKGEYDKNLASLTNKEVVDGINAIRTKESSNGFQTGQEVVWDLISRMLELSPENRISVKEVLSSLPT